MEERALYGSHIIVKDREWPVGDGGLAFGYGKDFCIIHSGKMLDTLPIEFFNHDLMEVNPNDEFVLADFAEKWGLVFHPARFGYCRLSLSKEVEDAFYETDSSAEEFERHESKKDPYLDMFSGNHLVVSAAEMGLAIKHLQEAVKSLRALVKGEPEAGRIEYTSKLNGNSFAITGKECLQLINVGSSAPKTISISWNDSEPDGWLDDSYIQHSGFTLTNAICNQIIETAASYADWQVCRYCETPFKFQRDYSPKAATDRKQSQTAYCCDKCRQSYKDARRGKRTLPKWWSEEKKTAFLKENPNAKLPRKG